MDTLQAGQTCAPETFDSVNPATSEVIATFPVFGQAEVNAAVERAQTSRAHIQRLGDRVSSVFVPVVVLVALTAACWWGLAPESAIPLLAPAPQPLMPLTA